MRYLLLFFLSFSALAQWVPEAEILSKSWTKVYSRKSCPGTCHKIPKGEIDPSFVELEEVMVNDLDKPVMSKTDIVECTAVADDPATTEIDETQSLENNCVAKLAALDCTGKGKAIRALDNSEVYCSVLLRYEQKLAGYKKAAVNQTLKSQWETSRNVQKAQEAAINSQVQDMNFGRSLYASVQLLNKGKGLTKAQRRQLRQDLKTMREDLLDGSLCDVRADLLTLPVNGTTVTEADKAAILAKLDAYKTCP